MHDLLPLNRQGHGKAVDWWAYGVLIYEMLAGYPPFYEEDTTQTYQRILHGRFGFPPDFPVTARDLVRKLLQVRVVLDLLCCSLSMAWRSGVHNSAVLRSSSQPVSLLTLNRSNAASIQVIPRMYRTPDKPSALHVIWDGVVCKRQCTTLTLWCSRISASGTAAWSAA